MKIFQTYALNYILIILLTFAASWYFISNDKNKLVSASKKSIESVVTISSFTSMFGFGSFGFGDTGPLLSPPIVAGTIGITKPAAAALIYSSIAALSSFFLMLPSMSTLWVNDANFLPAISKDPVG